MASEAKTGSATSLRSRWCCSSEVANGRPTRRRFRGVTIAAHARPGRPRRSASHHGAAQARGPALARTSPPFGRSFTDFAPLGRVPLRFGAWPRPAASSGSGRRHGPQGDGMHVVVVGCGRVGSELAGSLQASGHTVAVIDKSQDSFRRLGPAFGGRTIVGYGFDRGTLVEAGVEQAFALAAVTSGDNSNIVTARVARENFGLERVVARIYDPRRAAIFQKLGIPTVATVSWTTDQVLRRLLPSEHHSEWLDPTGAVALIELAVPPGLAGVKLA